MCRKCKILEWGSLSICSLYRTGRTSFYDEYGVIRDVIQNHLTEILTLVAMEIPRNLSNSEDVLRAKLELLGSLQSPEQKSAVIGQYQNYLAQVREEMEKNQNYFTNTPTFAGKLLLLNIFVVL